MDAVNIDQFNAAVESIFNSEEGAEYRKQLEHVRSAQKAAWDKARNLPHIFSGNMADGVYRYAEGGENIALIKDGDSYTIYDYESRNITKPSSIPFSRKWYTFPFLQSLVHFILKRNWKKYLPYVAKTGFIFS